MPDDDSLKIRKDVWRLATWDPVLDWYARAVADMQTRPITDPTSWRYQAAVHDYVVGRDPIARAGEKLPSTAEQQKFWRQCQHGSWFFLPWHRWYLWYFERIVAATIVKLGGPTAWALPYWNYSDERNPDALKLPPAFRATTMPDGRPNSLLVAERAPACNLGQAVGDALDIDLRRCLTEDMFSVTVFGRGGGFGGPSTGFHHSPGTTGSLEATPHGSMHSAVGGDGWMSAFNTAALDPIFWLHHANIDRLWEVWRRRDPARHTNPTERDWLTMTFDFHDAAGAVVTPSIEQVVDMTAAPLRYTYEDMSDPLAGVPPRLRAPRPLPMEVSPMPEMVAATSRPLTLGTGTTTSALSIQAPTGPARLRSAAGAARTIYLNLENVTGAGAVGGYAVYLNAPPGASASQRADHLAGLLPTFGLAEASRPDNEHGGSGLQIALNVTDLVSRLEAQPGWDSNRLTVEFVYRGAPTDAATIQVGRVSLYYA